MKTVLVTGFGPFGEHHTNASWECVKQLRELTLGEDVQLVTHQLPVVYTTVKQKVPDLWTEHKPDLVVHVGVSGVASELTLETRGHNTGYDRPDVEGCAADGLCCVETADDCILAGIDMEAVCTVVNDSACKTKAVISKDAGRYLCDFSFYSSLHINRDRCAFVHVPPIGKPYTVHEMAEALKVAILEMLKQVGERCGTDGRGDSEQVESV
ncbi:pyroglutamyl-peptidase 1-like [Mya arenaria]|uniref:pyroglutamyl-peptidase 1-like n=1 Tax=Mya arenaria TaxID=6604 RepID=UPI0022E4EE99|nr:pyroglutamyl-peptidase 1-like [Mya arenaria]